MYIFCERGRQALLIFRCHLSFMAWLASIANSFMKFSQQIVWFMHTWISKMKDLSKENTRKISKWGNASKRVGIFSFKMMKTKQMSGSSTFPLLTTEHYDHLQVQTGTIQWKFCEHCAIIIKLKNKIWLKLFMANESLSTCDTTIHGFTVFLWYSNWVLLWNMQTFKKSEKKN